MIKIDELWLKYPAQHVGRIERVPRLQAQIDRYIVGNPRVINPYLARIVPYHVLVVCAKTSLDDQVETLLLSWYDSP